MLPGRSLYNSMVTFVFLSPDLAECLSPHTLKESKKTDVDDLKKYQNDLIPL